LFWHNYNRPDTGICDALQLDEAVTQRQRDGMSSVHSAKLPHRGLNVLVDRPLVMWRISPASQADLPFATQRRTSISRAVSLPFTICRLGKRKTPAFDGISIG
jgi:hypothetical protein